MARLHPAFFVFLAGASLLGLCVFHPVANGAETAGTAASPVVPEPLFSRHVAPLFSRLGCNAGSCHGAVKGQNGFRLSLFGVDPALDHSRLLREFGGRRLNLADPDSSLLLLKTVSRVAHEGGKRTQPDSPDYQVLRTWIAQGARLDDLARSRIKELRATPVAQTLKPGEGYQLRVAATFADGSTEDVTGLCTFETLDKEVANVSSQGRVEAHGVGDTTVIVRYRAEPVMVMVVVPRIGNEPFPEVRVSNVVDTHITAKLKRLNIHPSELCDDATFLRRASLHVTGLPPTPEEVRNFLADVGPDKRVKKIDELLSSPGYAAVWATKFCDILRTGSYPRHSFLKSTACDRRFYEWLRQRLTENTPYDELTERILLASSREGRSEAAWLEEVQTLLHEEKARDAELKSYSDRRTLDLYWLRANATGIQGALQVAHAFLGLRLECAQCHRHPHDVWTQSDLLGFGNFFTRVGIVNRPNDPNALKKQLADRKLSGGDDDPLVKVLEQGKVLTEQAKELEAKAKGLPKAEADKIVQEAKALHAQAALATEAVSRINNSEVMVLPSTRYHVSVTSPLGTQTSNQFRLLGATGPVGVPEGKDPRELVMDWLRRPDNPYLARAMVNRVWAHYLGRGIVDPPDHLSPLNPPSHPELLQELCAGFIENKYDLKWLHRNILNSQTYQRSQRTNPTNRADTRNFASFYPQRLPAEVLVDALNQATGGSETYPPHLFAPPGTRAIAVAGALHDPNSEEVQAKASVKFAFQIFGRPTRSTEIQCDCERDNAATMVQALYLRNHPHVLAKLANPQGRLAQIVKDIPGDERRIEEIFLWAVSRPPTREQLQTCLEHVKKSPSAQQGLEDVLWSLLNTDKFLLNQ